MKTMTVQENGKQFARLVNRIIREEGIAEKEFTRRLSWSRDRVNGLLQGEIPLDRRIKVAVALALGLGLKPELRQPKSYETTGFEDLTDEELNSLFDRDLPESYKY